MRPVAIISGGAGGIGLATGRCLAAEGYRVVLADLDGVAAGRAASRLGADHLGIAVDITEEASVEALVVSVIETCGRIDALVNNAGIGDQPGATLDQSADAFDRVLQVHLRGTFLMSRRVGREMLRQGDGAIVNLSSIAGLGGIPTRNAYGAAKAGIVAMTRSMACEWARQGVRVNAVAPGYVRTELVVELARRGAIDLAALERRTPMGRLADPEEIADSIAFLLSPRAGYITGTSLAADGGWLALGAPESTLDPKEV